MSENQIKEEIEKIGYKEFYRYYKEKDILLHQQQQELDQYKNKVEYYENFEINKTVDKIRLRHNKEIKELYQKIDQYKNNWEELKKWLNYSIMYRVVLNKMKELEEDK